MNAFLWNTAGSFTQPGLWRGAGCVRKLCLSLRLREENGDLFLARVKNEGTYELCGKQDSEGSTLSVGGGDLRSKPSCSGRKQILRDKIISKGHWNMKQGNDSIF